MILVFIIYQSIVIPFRLCFNVNATGGIYIFETAMDVSFMIDIVITFNTGFYRKGYLVMKRKDIIINYIKTWFFIDMLASFPYNWVFTDSNSSTSSSYIVVTSSTTTTTSSSSTTPIHHYNTVSKAP